MLTVSTTHAQIAAGHMIWIAPCISVDLSVYLSRVLQQDGIHHTVTVTVLCVIEVFKSDK